MKFVLKFIDGEKAIECKFSAHGLLFLISTPAGLTLSMMPLEGHIVYAAFIRGRRRVTCAALHADVRLEGGDRVRQIKDGDRIAVGPLRLTMSARRDERSRKHFRAGDSVKFICAAAALFAAAVFVARSFTRPHPSRSPAHSGPFAIAGEIAGQEDAATGLLEEARAYLRDGKGDQARLTLLQAMEMAPEDARAKDLMARLDDAEAVAPPRNDWSQDLQKDAEGLFEEGRELAERGEFAMAAQRFDSAAEVLEKVGVKPPFAASMEALRHDAGRKIEDQVAAHLARASDHMKSSEGMQSGVAIEKLALADAEVEAARMSLPHDPGVLELDRKVEMQIAAVAERWFLGAVTAERLSGCKSALPVYLEIADRLHELENKTASLAAERAGRCEARRPEGGN